MLENPQSRLNSRIAAGGAALLVFAGALLLYIPTAAPGVWWGDGPELTAAAWCLGVAHEPGYPLYMLTGHAITKALHAFVAPIRAMTLYSAVLLAAGCALLVPLLGRAVRDACKTIPDSAVTLLAALLAFLTATAYTVWEHGTFAEVYPLTFFLSIALVLIAWRSPDGSRRDAALLAFVTGLASTNHYSILALYPLAGMRLIQYIHRSPARLKTAAIMFACWFMPLLLYLYLPIRARTSPPLNESNPSTLQSLITYVTAQRYAHYRSFWPADPIGSLMRWVGWWGRQWAPQDISDALAGVIGAALVIAAVAGLIRLALRRPVVGCGLILALNATLAFSLFYHIYDIEPYFLVALPAALIGWVYCAAPLARRFPHAAALATLFVSVLAIMHNRSGLNLSSDRAPEIYARALLDEMEPGGVFIGEGDSALFPLFYEQIVNGRRPDVAIFYLDWFYFRWYNPYLGGEYSDRIPFQIPRRRMVDNSLFTRDITNGLLRPAFSAGRKVYCVLPPIQPLDTIFKRRPVRELLQPNYELPPSRAFMMPGPRLEEILPNPAALAMSDNDFAALVDNKANPQPTQGASRH